MEHIFVGETVVNKNKQVGTIAAFDGRFITVDFQGRNAMFQLDAFEKGFLCYENATLQGKLDEVKNQEKQKADEIRLAKEKAAEERRTVQAELSKSHFNVAVLNAQIRLAPAPISWNSVRKKDQELIQAIFSECDQEINSLYSAVNPEMSYLRYGSGLRSKYCVAFLCKYQGVYVFRVFSRNDDYNRSSDGAVTVTLSDVTEVLRVLRVNGKVYYFSKNLSAGGEYLVNTKAHKNWHVSKLDSILMVNKIIQNCDCEYLNNYIAKEHIDCLQYLNLMVPAFYNNKVEIVFKHGLFGAAHRINDIEAYLEEFTPKQITVACQNRSFNVLPVIKRYGNLEPETLMRMETLLRKRRDGRSIYTTLENHISRAGFYCPDLEKKVIGFLKKVENFDPAIYEDYINLLADEPGVTLPDFFDKDYTDRHIVLAEQNGVKVLPWEKEKYAQVAAELSWIDREIDDFFIVIPKSITEFRAEGAAQHNCVFTNRYYRAVIDRQSVIVFLRRDKNISYVTIEFDYETFEVYQAFGVYNTKIAPELYQYIVNLGKQLYIEKHSQQ